MRGQHKQIARLIRNGLLFKLVIGLGLFLVCFALSDYLATDVLKRPDITVYIRFASTTIIARVITTTAFSAFVGLDRMEYSALTMNVEAFSKAVISILLVILGFSVMGALIGLVLSFLIGGILSSALLYFRLYQPLTSRQDEDDVGSGWKDSIKLLVIYGSPLYVSALLLGIATQFQSITLGFFTSDYDIGNFKASLNFVSLLSALTLPMATSLFPAFSKFKKGSEKVKTFFGLATKYASLIVVPSALLTIVLSREIIVTVYGESFTSASIYLSLHATLFLLIGLGHKVQISLFNGLGKTRETLKLTLIEFVLFLILAASLTSVLGVIGLIASILASSIVATLYGACAAKSRCKVEFNHTLIIRIYLIALASALPAFLCTRLQSFPATFIIVLASLVYSISYLTLLPLGRAITRQELKDVDAVIKKIGPLKWIANLVLKYEYAILRS